MAGHIVNDRQIQQLIDIDSIWHIYVYYIVVKNGDNMNMYEWYLVDQERMASEAVNTLETIHHESIQILSY